MQSVRVGEIEPGDGFILRCTSSHELLIVHRIIFQYCYEFALLATLAIVPEISID